ncbi:MAG: hypothetical protein ACRYFW_11440 [Janthinobacterium lividum]
MTDLRLDIDALVGRVADGEGVWAMVLRRHPRPAAILRLGWIARLRRQRRRRAGWRPGQLSLHAAAGRVDLLLHGARIASLRFAPPCQDQP